MTTEPSKTKSRRPLRIILRVARAALLCYFLVALGLSCAQDKLVYHPVRGIDVTPEAAGLDFEEVSFAAADGVKLHGWFIPAENPRAVILHCHGNAGNISHRLELLRICHDLGLSTFIFDYRGYGRSEGTPTEDGTYLDAEAAWKYLTETRKVPPGEIIFHGQSLGGAVAANLASKHTPRALILESTFTSIPDWTRSTALAPFCWVCRYRYDTKAILPNLHCPVLVIHSPGDDLIPYRHGRRLFELANEPKRFVEIRGDHNSGFLVSGATYTEGLRGFVAEQSK
jgi:hypothetical protein